MAENNTIKTKELPIVSLDVEINTDDRVVATHVVDANTRETVGITVGALRDKFLADATGTSLFPRNIFDTVDPTSDVGNDGDLYFKTNSGTVESAYFKMNGEWYPFKISDDNWNKFLNGEAFDVISMAKSVKAHAFENNSLLSRVIMPECENVYEYAFKGSSIRELSMPKLERAWEYSFADTDNWVPNSRFEFPSLKAIDSNAFRDIHYLPNKKNIYLDISNVETIGSGAFYESPAVVFLPYTAPYRELILPRCTSIGSGAFGCFYHDFRNCIHNVDLESIELIGEQAFRSNDFRGDSSNHGRIRLGPNITRIESGILYNIYNNIGYRGTDPTYGHNIYGAYLDMYIEAVTPPTLSGFFYGWLVSFDDKNIWVECIFPNIYVPEESVNVYKTHANWSRYADYIQAIPTT